MPKFGIHQLSLKSFLITICFKSALLFVIYFIILELRPGKSEGRPVPETSSTSQDDQGLSRSYSGPDRSSAVPYAGPDRPTSFAGQLSSSYSEADAVATSTIRVVELDSSGVVTQEWII